MKKTAILFATLVALSSCSTTKWGSTKTSDILGAGVIHIPVVADLDVQEKKVVFTKQFSKTESIDKIKAEAVRELLKLHKADVLIEPYYSAETSGGTTILQLTGWPATYKNFRKITKEDAELLSIANGYLHKANTVSPTVEYRKK